MKVIGLFSVLLVAVACKTAVRPAMRPQNPSPMVEYTRAHGRVPLDSIPLAGVMTDLSPGIQGRFYVPEKWKSAKNVDLVIHFHGDARVAQYAVDRQESPWVLFHCQWGSGSSAYSRPVQAIGAGAFLDSVQAAIRKAAPDTRINRIYLSGWSAGYGAIRSLISDEKAADRVNGILLLDGLHCSYVPEGKPMAEGGVMDSTQMQPFLNWAERAVSGKRSFLFTHSAVFPGTFASTTETADYLLQALGIKRQPQLAEGPVGMQQTSVATRGKFTILSFAGNSAPDHVDHYHGMSVLLKKLE
ncbi:MAG TPA: hypothetical protein PKE06_26115 [Flavilitoribacter sp.]|nr:hypothetical protein [Flavilitoribacter sp.]HMQ86392.1 hypothetical protein [Flavilitoribacter sp.]